MASNTDSSITGSSITGSSITGSAMTDAPRNDDAPVSAPSAPERDEELPMEMLEAGIPLTLLMDLAENFGPPSQEILSDEHEAAPAPGTQPWWVPPAREPPE